MGLGVNALESLLNRISKKTASFGNQPISVVYIEANGDIHFPVNCNETGLLAVPRKVTPEQWELQNTIDDQKGRSSLD